MRKSLMVSILAISLLVGCSDPKSSYTPPDNENLQTVGDIVPGQIALDLTDNLNASEIEQLGKDYGIKINNLSPNAHELGNLEQGIVDVDRENQVLSQMAHDPRVEVAEPMIMAHALFTPNDEQFNEQWGFHQTNVQTAYNHTCGQGTITAVVDTGMTPEDKGGYKALSDLKDNSFVPGYNFVQPGEFLRDDQGHGSHCSGTIAQTTNNKEGVAGIAYCTHLMPVKVLSSTGNGSMIGVAEGIVWAADHGANVISLSLGSSSDSAIVAKAVKYAHSKGVFLSCAAGNSGGSVGYPAANKGCVAVSASDPNGNLASFSSRGPEVAIAAPGVDILQQTISEGGQGRGIFKKFSGTSMSTPAISAAASDLISMGITDPDKVLEKLQSTAVEKQDHTKFGAGIVDVGGAVKNVYYHHLLLRLGLLGLFTFLLLTILKKNGQQLVSGNLKTVAAVSALFTGVGLFFFLPMTGLLPHLGSFRWIGDLLSRPFAEWDLAYNVSWHKFLPLASALPIFGLVALGNHKPLLRTIAGGMAIGMCAYLGQICYSNEIQFIFGSLAMRAWTLVNIAALLWVAKNTLASK